MNQELREQAIKDVAKNLGIGALQAEFHLSEAAVDSKYTRAFLYAVEQRTLVLELKDKLRRYHEAATSWHNFHHGTAIQCDNICLAMDYAAPLLATIDQEKA